MDFSGEQGAANFHSVSVSTKHFTVYLTSFRLDEGTYLIRIEELEARAKLACSEALYL